MVLAFTLSPHTPATFSATWKAMKMLFKLFKQVQENCWGKNAWNEIGCEYGVFCVCVFMNRTLRIILRRNSGFETERHAYTLHIQNEENNGWGREKKRRTECGKLMKSCSIVINIESLVEKHNFNIHGKSLSIIIFALNMYIWYCTKFGAMS